MKHMLSEAACMLLDTTEMSESSVEVDIGKYGWSNQTARCK